jgi:hypothetical protein
MGVIFFIMNAAFALVLLILVLVASIYALVSKNPDVRYQPMRDDRGSFIKSNSQMTPSTELDALGATARGDMKSRDLEDDGDSFSNSKPHYDATQVPLPPSTAGSIRAPSHFDVPRSPVDTSVPLFPSNSHDGSRQAYGQSPQNAGQGVALLTPGGIPARAPSRGGATSPSSSQRSYDYGQPPPSSGGGQMPSGGNWNVGVGYH